MFHRCPTLEGMVVRLGPYWFQWHEQAHQGPGNFWAFFKAALGLLFFILSALSTVNTALKKASKCSFRLTELRFRSLFRLAFAALRTLRIVRLLTRHGTLRLYPFRGLRIECKYCVEKGFCHSKHFTPLQGHQLEKNCRAEFIRPETIQGKIKRPIRVGISVE